MHRQASPQSLRQILLTHDLAYRTPHALRAMASGVNHLIIVSGSNVETDPASSALVVRVIQDG